MAQTVKASIVLASAWGAAGFVASRGRSFLAHTGGMRPDLAAHTLVRVEDDWTAQAAAFLSCSESDEVGESCQVPHKAFEQSCSTVVSSIVQASSGDRDRVLEYMNDVCRQEEMDDRHKARCQSLMSSMMSYMSPDSYTNRDTWDSSPLCTRFWERVKDEESHFIQEQRAKELEAQKAEMEEAKLRQAAEDASIAAAAKKAEEAAKAEQEADLAAKKAEEAAKADQEAKAAKAKQEAEEAKAAEAEFGGSETENSISVANVTKTEHAAKSTENQVQAVAGASIAKDSKMEAKVEPKFANATSGNATIAAVNVDNATKAKVVNATKALPKQAMEVVKLTKAI